MKTIDPDRASKRACELFDSGWNCAESVFVAVHEQAGTGEAPVHLVTPLGGGMGCKRVCGAVGGGNVALGIVYGRTTPDEAAKKVAMAKARELSTAFREKYHSMECWELTSAFGDENERRRFCAEIVGSTAAMVAEAMRQPSK